MNRIACPTCSCGFGENRDIFPYLTSAYVHQLLQKIKSQKALSEFLNDERINIEYEDGELQFPPGICKSVQNKLRIKIEKLGIEVPDRQLELDPASNPDNKPPKISDIIHESGSLSFDGIEEDFLAGKTAWKPQEDQFYIDE